MFPSQGANKFGGIVILLLQVPEGETDNDLEWRETAWHSHSWDGEIITMKNSPDN